jgi:alpha-glucuronidase
MPELRTRSAGAKVTDKEYAEIEKLAEARGLNVGEWCREVLLAEVERAGVSHEAPSAETVLAEVMALRMLVLNMVGTLLRGEGMTTEKIQALIERVDGDKFRRVAEVVEAQAARKKPPREAREKPSGDGKR